MKFNFDPARGSRIAPNSTFTQLPSKESKSTEAVSLQDFISVVQGGDHQAEVAQVRAVSGDQQKALKADLPCYIISGEFQGGHHMSNRIRHSGLICMDFDFAENPQIAGNDELVEDLGADQFSRFTFRTCSGRGLAVLAYIDGARHLDSWRALAVYFLAEFGLTADPSGKNENRLRFTSWDDKAQENPSAREFRRYSLAKEEASSEVKASTIDNPISTERANELRSALSLVSPDDRDSWLRVGMALHSECRGMPGFALWKEWSLLNDTQGKFDDADLLRTWQSLGQSSERVQVETLFHMAKEAGWRMPKPIETREEVVSDRYQILNGNVFRAMEDEPADPVVENLFEVMDKIAIIAPSKSYKSWFLQQLGMSIATATDFLGMEVSKARKVLFVQFEVKEKWQLKRFKSFERGAGMENVSLENFNVINARGQGVVNLKRAIIDAAFSTGADVVILDPLYVMVDGNENDGEVMRDLMLWMDQLMLECECALVYSHHDAKGKPGDRDTRDRGSGSNMTIRAADTVLTLTHHAEIETGVVVDILNRNYQSPNPFTAVFADCVLHRTSDAPVPKTSATERKKSSERDPITDRSAVEKLLLDRGPIFGSREFVSIVSDALGISGSTAQKLKSKLIRDGAMDGEPVPGHRRKAFVYLPSQADKVRDLVTELVISK